MQDKVKIYIDKGANIRPLESLWHICEFIRSPIDAKDNTVSWRKLGAPTDICLQDANWAYGEDDNSLNDYVSSEHLGNIYKIIGSDPKNRRDGLHLDSAYKSNVEIFLTEDKGIWNSRDALTQLLKFQIFNTSAEVEQIISCIKKRSLTPSI